MKAREKGQTPKPRSKPPLQTVTRSATETRATRNLKRPLQRGSTVTEHTKKAYNPQTTRTSRLTEEGTPESQMRRMDAEQKNARGQNDTRKSQRTSQPSIHSGNIPRRTKGPNRRNTDIRSQGQRHLHTPKGTTARHAHTPQHVHQALIKTPTSSANLNQFGQSSPLTQYTKPARDREHVRLCNRTRASPLHQLRAT